MKRAILLTMTQPQVDPEICEWPTCWEPIFVYSSGNTPEDDYAMCGHHAHHVDAMGGIRNCPEMEQVF